MQLLIQPQVSLTNTTFKSAQYIKAARCACCNNIMIDNDMLGKTYASASRSINSNFKAGIFSFLEEKFPNILSLLTQFKTKFPRLSLGTILYKDDNYTKFKNSVQLDIKGLPKEEFEGSDIKSFANNLAYKIVALSHHDMQKSASTMRKFSKYKKYLTGEKLKTFEQLEIYAQKYPNLTLSEILNLDEVYKFHMQKDFLQRIESREKLDFHFANVKNMIMKKCPDKAEYLDDLKEYALETYDNRKDEKQRLYIIKELYRNALNELGCSQLEKKVMKELEAIPITFITKDSFLVYAKNHNYPDGAIMESILSPYMRSEEHIVARSNGGNDKWKNKIYMCRSCNLKRKSYPYTQFLEYHPEMIKNTKKQVNRFIQGVLNGKIEYSPSTVLYPIEVSDILRQVTEGKIDINTTEYAQEMFAKSKRIMHANNEEMFEKKRQIQQLYSDRKELERKNSSEEALQRKIFKYINSKES